MLICEVCFDFFSDSKCKQMFDIIGLEEYNTQYFDIDEHLRMIEWIKERVHRE